MYVYIYIYMNSMYQYLENSNLKKTRTERSPLGSQPCPPFFGKLLDHRGPTLDFNMCIVDVDVEIDVH